MTLQEALQKIQKLKAENEKLKAQNSMLEDEFEQNDVIFSEYGDEYFEGSLDVVRKYYDEVVKEFKDEE